MSNVKKCHSAHGHSHKCMERCQKISTHSKSLHRKITGLAGNITANTKNVTSDINNYKKNKWTNEL